jgi:uncharacterized membrane-anchored protein YhcB (DUF1043 family)
MRTAIVIIVSLAIGVVIGALGLRGTMAGQMQSLDARLEASRQSYESKAAELNALQSEYNTAIENLNDLRRQNEQLRARMTSLGGEAAASAQPSEDADAEAGSRPVRTARNASGGQDYATPEPYYTSQREAPPAGAVAVEDGDETFYVFQQRRRIEDILMEDAQLSNDPQEQERLASIHEHLRYVRDLYKDLHEVETPEEKQEVLDLIVRTRSNLKNLVENQQFSMMAGVLEDSGVDDPGEQRRLIDELHSLQKSPYWTEPSMIWGMAAEDRPQG